MKKLLIVLLVVIVCCFSGCEIFKNLTEDTKKATQLASNFCYAISNNDLLTAQSYLHGDSNLNSQNLSYYIIELENELNVKFSNGIYLGKITHIQSTYYDSRYDGSVFEITCDAVINNNSYDANFLIVKNNKGFGIYSFTLTNYFFN